MKVKLPSAIIWFVFLIPSTAWGQDAKSCAPPSPYVAGWNAQTKILKVLKIEGRARAALNGTKESHDVIMMNGACLALYSMPDGRLVATTLVSDDHFHFATPVPGRYRIVSVLSSNASFAPIDAPIELKLSRKRVSTGPTIYLHFRYLRFGVASYASTTCKDCPNL